MKYLSRKLVVTFVFGLLIPMVFRLMEISDAVTLAAMGLGAAYAGANVLEKKWTR